MSTAMPPSHPELVSASLEVPPAARRARTPAGSILRQTVQCLVVMVSAVASYLIISNFLLQSVRVAGRSMMPSLADSQRYLLNRWIYRVHAPRHSDIVVLRDPGDDGFSVKRVIATPGDSIYLKGGSVYLNGCKLNEPYLAPGTRTFSDSKYLDQLFLCGKDQFFVLGDNRANSIDSRAYGPVPRRNILGPLIR